MVGLHDFTLCQNAARSDKFCFLCWVDYSLEGSTFWGPFFFYQLGRGGGGEGWVLLECVGGKPKNGFKGDGGVGKNIG